MVKKKNIYTVDLSEVKDKVETSKTIHIHIYKKNKRKTTSKQQHSHKHKHAHIHLTNSFNQSEENVTLFLSKLQNAVPKKGLR